MSTKVPLLDPPTSPLEKEKPSHLKQTSSNLSYLDTSNKLWDTYSQRYTKHTCKEQDERFSSIEYHLRDLTDDDRPFQTEYRYEWMWEEDR